MPLRAFRERAVPEVHRTRAADFSLDPRPEAVKPG